MTTETAIRRETAGQHARARVFTLRDVARLVGVSEITIIQAEQAGRICEPQRDAVGARAYGLSELALVRRAFR